VHAAVRYVDNPELLQSLADEYVVGTLAGRARRRFERLSETHAAARDAVRQAEDRLVALSVALTPVEPRAETWTRIVSRTGGTDRAGVETATPQKRARLPANRWALAAAFAIAVVGLSWLVFQQEPRPTALASVAVEGGAELWALEVFGDRDRLTARVTGAIKQEPGRSYELWALPEGGAPVSLGLLPAAGELDRELTAAQQTALRTATKVAVSLEPAGGSTTGAPTGPVLYVAPLQPVAS
jgi:anti-sigma-K factor RskA